MALRYRRRSERQDGSALTMFGGAGWLFADLMLALAVAFLVADTVSTPAPPSPPKAAHPRPAVHHQPTPTPTPSPSGPALDLGYITVNVKVGLAGLQAGSAQTEASVRAQIEQQANLTGRRVGLVLLFAGQPNPDSQTDHDAAISLDKKMAGVLTSLSIDGGLVFEVAAYRNFANYGDAANTIELDIYLFKQ